MTNANITITSTIPWLDMNAFFSGNEALKIATGIAFGKAMQELGFVAINNIGINKSTIDNAYRLAEKFFSLPDDEKMRVRARDGHCGFLPFGTEHAKYTDVMDLKEFFQTTGASHPDDLWPAMTDFKTCMLNLYRELEEALRLCLQAVAISLGYQDLKERTILSDMLGHNNGLMRVLYYPPVDPKKHLKGAVRSAAHEDLSMMTVIPRATSSGLQVLNREGKWLDVVVPDNAAIINAGDTLSYITNGIIPSTTHRVINPDDHDRSPRFSIPFFGSLPFETKLNVLDTCKGAGAHKKIISFGEFLKERYQAIGLM